LEWYSINDLLLSINVEVRQQLQAYSNCSKMMFDSKIFGVCVCILSFSSTIHKLPLVVIIVDHESLSKLCLLAQLTYKNDLTRNFFFLLFFSMWELCTRTSGKGGMRKKCT